MSTAAKFLLEFQATGDQEIVQKLRDIGVEGQLTAGHLRELQAAGDDISDSLGRVADSTEAVADPMTEMSAATEGLGGIFAEAGTEAEGLGAGLDAVSGATEAANGGLSETTTLAEGMTEGMGGAAESSGNLSGAMTGLTGNITALGGTMGTAIATAFRFRDAQIRLDAANLKASKSAEAMRKAHAGFDQLLEGVKTNTEGVTAAREAYATAQERVTELEKAGKQGTAEYAEAQAQLQAATGRLRNEFAAGGGDVGKFDGALAKVKNTTAAHDINVRKAAKAQEGFNATILETPFAVAGLAGAIIQSAGSLDKMKANLGTVSSAIKTKVGPSITGLGKDLGLAGFGAAGLASKFGLVARAAGPVGLALAAAYEAFIAGQIGAKEFEAVLASLGGNMEKSAGKVKEAWDLSDLSITNSGVLGTFEALGINIDDAANKAVEGGKKMDASAAKSKESLTKLKDESGWLAVKVGQGKEEFYQFGEILIRNGDNAQFAAGEWRKLADGTVQIKTGTQNAAQGVVVLDKEVVKLGSTLGDTMVETTGVSDSIASLGNISQTGAAGAQQMTDSILNLGGGASELQNSIIPLYRGIDEMNFSVDTSIDRLAYLNQGFNALNKGIPPAAKDTDLFAEALLRQDRATESVIRQVEIMGHTVTEFGGSLRMVDGVLQQHGKTVSFLYPTVNELTGAVEHSDSALAKQAETLGYLNDITGTWSNTTGQATDAVITQNDALTKSLEAIIGPTTSLNAALNQEAQALAIVTDADVEAVEATENRNRALIAANSAVNNSQKAEILYQQALTDLTQKLYDNTAANNANADALLTMAGSAENAREAISSVHLEYAQSVDRLNDLIAVQESEIATQDRLNTAHNEGVISIKEWAMGLGEAQAAQEGQIAELEAMGFTFDDLPNHVAPTIENLKAFAGAAMGSAESAREAASIMAESFRNATSEIGGELDSLAEIVKKGGEDMGTAFDEGLATIEQKIGRGLTNAEKAAIQGTTHMMAETEQTIANWQLGQLMGETAAQSGEELARGFESIGGRVEGALGQVFQRAAQIVRQNPEMASAVNEVMANAGKTAPEALLNELNTLPGLMKNKVTAAGQGLPGSLDPAAGQAGQSAALTLSQEFAAAGTHIATVVKGMGANMTGLADVARTAGQNAAAALSEGFSAAVTHITSVLDGLKQRIGALGSTAGTGINIPVTVDITQAANQLQSLVATMQSIKARPIPVTADISQAANQLQQLVATMQSIRARPIPVTVDITQAANQLQTLVATMQTLRAKPIPITANTSAATAAVTKLASQITSQLSRASQQAASRIATMAKPFPGIGQAAARAANQMASTFQSAASRAISAINRVRSAVNALPNIRRTITYTYRTSGRPPNPPNLNRTITYRYRTVGAPPARATGFAGEVSRPTMLLVGEQGRERVTVEPIGTGGIGVPGMGGTKGGYGSGGGGNGKMVIQGDVILDAHKVGRFVGRAIAENNA